MSKPPTYDRRTLLKAAARGAALTAIAAAAAVLLARGGQGSSRGNPPRPDCTGGNACSSCGSLDGCLLPPALSARQARRPS